MALAAYTPQPHKFNRFNKNGLFGRDTLDFIVTVNKGIEPPDCWIFLPPDIS